MNSNIQLIHGNSLIELAKLAENSVDSICTDPPYELGFMGCKWDKSGIAYNVELWAQCLRVLKPGGHLAAFSATRTYHRMAVAIEDAGFDIRDQLAWVYGSGFPKSLDVSKAIDKSLGADRKITREASAEFSGHGSTSFDMRASTERERRDIPATAVATAWEGWGTALKPAWEPICLARKPFKGTVAENVMTHGTAALNIDACRIPSEIETGWGGGGSSLHEGGSSPEGGAARPVQGRWPANLVHDGSDEVVACFPYTPGAQGAVTGLEPSAASGGTTCFGSMARTANSIPRGDSGSAARFFYTAKASAEDREAGLQEFELLNGGALTGRKEGAEGLHSPRAGAGRGGARANTHPTVKPTDLMVWLVRLITSRGGIVLDPFMGSGSTGRAAAICNSGFIGIDMTAEFLPIARARIDEAVGPLFRHTENE